jgi:hypothetical protein
LSAPKRVAAEDFSRLQRLGDLDGGVALQTGRLAGMNLVAERIAGFRIAD